jgi:hypothetical protein
MRQISRRVAEAQAALGPLSARFASPRAQRQNATPLDTSAGLHSVDSPAASTTAAATHFMPSTQIILTENIPGLGAEADVVKVRRGFARNFLLPQGKAYEVTKSSMRKLDMLKAKRAEREAKELNDAEKSRAASASRR